MLAMIQAPTVSTSSVTIFETGRCEDQKAAAGRLHGTVSATCHLGLPSSMKRQARPLVKVYCNDFGSL